MSNMLQEYKEHFLSQLSMEETPGHGRLSTVAHIASTRAIPNYREANREGKFSLLAAIDKDLNEQIRDVT